MKKTFTLENLDCANCASKIENAIKEIKGVQSASVSFMMQKLVLEAADEQFEQILAQVKKTIAQIEPDCEITG